MAMPLATNVIATTYCNLSLMPKLYQLSINIYINSKNIRQIKSLRCHTSQTVW
ncbi:Uncharacterised protein [Segatella buccae]|uniref:Uncharacterized protein n=1 Tax=Segatella buccae TaxID=28126 RepID=A0AAQ1UFZ8_9BACT|nr:Uncharacterised protein [Segatella buccae]